VFQKLMDVVLCGLSYMTFLVYLDDIIIFGRSFDEQLARLREVFSRIGWANLKLKRSKCSNLQTCSGVSRVILMSLSKRGANSVVPTCIDISTNIVRRKI